MSADIAARIADFLQRQTAALHAVERDWLPWADGHGELSDDDLTAIETTQQRHAQLMVPLEAEFQSLWNEWERSESSSEDTEATRRLAHDVAAVVARVHALEQRLHARLQAQMKSVASAGDAVRRGIKLTRGYGGTGANDASYIDRDA